MHDHDEESEHEGEDEHGEHRDEEGEEQEGEDQDGLAQVSTTDEMHLVQDCYVFDAPATLRMSGLGPPLTTQGAVPGAALDPQHDETVFGQVSPATIISSPAAPTPLLSALVNLHVDISESA